MNKTPLSIMLAAAGILLAVSPEARGAARKLAVKLAGAMLDARDQIKEVTSEHG
jgi:hypothetical protein